MTVYTGFFPMSLFSVIKKHFNNVLFLQFVTRPPYALTAVAEFDCLVFSHYDVKGKKPVSIKNDERI
jgi:hypothetical protein